jgi:hypothetical protein
MKFLLAEFLFNLHVCTAVGLFYFQLGLRACSVFEILKKNELRRKSTTGRVGANKQIVGLYVIDI